MGRRVGERDDAPRRARQTEAGRSGGDQAGLGVSGLSRRHRVGAGARPLNGANELDARCEVRRGDWNGDTAVGRLQLDEDGLRFGDDKAEGDGDGRNAQAGGTVVCHCLLRTSGCLVLGFENGLLEVAGLAHFGRGTAGIDGCAGTGNERTRKEKGNGGERLEGSEEDGMVGVVYMGTAGYPLGGVQSDSHYMRIRSHRIHWIGLGRVLLLPEAAAALDHLGKQANGSLEPSNL